MKISECEIADVLVIESDIYTDERGSFQELWRKERFENRNLYFDFVQDNVVTSAYGVLRGLHYQEPFPQGKLVSVISGRIFDVAVDIRPDSPTVGKWVGNYLEGGSGISVYIPEGFAHGYQVVSAEATVLYKCTEKYHPSASRAIRWDDPDFAIEWPVESPKVSDRDLEAGWWRSE